MLSQDYLALRLIRLKSAEEWLSEPQRLTFVFPKGGSGKHISGLLTQPLAAGDVLIANTSSGGKVCVHQGGEAMFWAFSVCVENLFPLCTAREICLLQNVVDGLKRPRFYPAASPAASECHRLIADVPTHCDLSHRSQLLRIVSLILSMEFKQAQQPQHGFAGAQEHLIQIFESLSSVEILNLSVEELAEKFSCTRRHLNRLFHQHFGFSLATLKMEMRLLKALSLLRDPTAKVINVAEECGFNHLGLFNTCFKRRFGASPGKYRKVNGLPESEPSKLARPEAACPLHSKGLCPMSGSREVQGPIGQPASKESVAASKSVSTGPKPPKQKAGKRAVLRESTNPESRPSSKRRKGA